MKITNNTQINFKAAQVNILAMADSHGNVQNLPQLVKTVDDNQKDIFIKKDEKSTLNVFALAGDFFMNPLKKGFMTNPQMSNGDVQANCLNKLVNSIKNISNNNFKAVYALGNHCYDGRDGFIFNKLKDAPMQTLVSNVDLSKSPLVTDLMKTHDNIVTSQIYEVDDDKNPNLKHKVLFMGVTIPSLKGGLDKTELINNGNKKDTQLTESDLEKTFEALNKQVKEFKDANPKGAVVLLSHMGAPLSKMINKNVSNIDVILNGHDHTRDNENVGKTMIASLGKDNEIVKSINLKFDDDGNVKNASFKIFETKNSQKDEALQAFLNKSFEKDVLPLIKIKDKSDEITELVYNDSIRYANSPLTNYLTDSLKKSALKDCPNLDAIALQSSYVRGGIKENATNLNLMKIFDGANIDSLNLNKGKVTGAELTGLVVENILSNLKAPTRNTIIQWSDVQTDRTLISNIQAGKSDKKYEEAVKIRNKETGEFEAIDQNKEYEIILPTRFLDKKDAEYAKLLKPRFESLNKNYDDYFQNFIKENNYEVEITDQVKEERIK